MKKVGFIGYGEATYNIIYGLYDCICEEIYVYNRNHTPRNYTVADNVSMIDTLSNLVQLSDIIIVAVPGDADESVFSQVLENNISDKLFIDICTTLPRIKNGIDNKVMLNKGLYVDAAILGSLPKYKNRVPLVISGSGASEFQRLYSKFCGNIQNVGSKAGDAITVKLCRSVYMKGLAALLIETRDISKELGIEEEVFSSIAESMNSDSFEIYSERLVNGTNMHCQRRKKELEDCICLFENSGVDDIMTRAVVNKYEKICKKK